MNKVSECCLMPIQQFFSYIMARTNTWIKEFSEQQKIMRLVMELKSVKGGKLSMCLLPAEITLKIYQGATTLEPYKE